MSALRSSTRCLLSSLRSSEASSSSRLAVGPMMVGSQRHHQHRVVYRPPREMRERETGRIINPLSPLAYDPNPPYLPLFPLYLPLTSINPTIPAEKAAEMVMPLPRDIFDAPLRKDILHQCVLQHMILLRTGTSQTPARNQLKGSSKKLHPQKGTGRARVGDRKAPGRHNGAKAHGPFTRDWSQPLNVKVKQLGLKIALSARVREGRLSVVDEDGLRLENWILPDGRKGASSSREVKKALDGRMDGTLLLLHSPYAQPDPELLPKSTLPFPNVHIHSISSIGAYDILKHQEIIVDKLALEWLIGKDRQLRGMVQAQLYDGNAMVMRRRSLGLSDFPKEGEEDESKRMLEELERELSGEGSAGKTMMEGGAGGYEIDEVNELGDVVEEAVEGGADAIPEGQLTEKEHEEIAQDANKLVEGHS